MLNLPGYFKINFVDVLFKDFQARLDVGVTFDDLVSAIRIQTGFQLVHVWVFDALGKSHLGFDYLVHALVVVNKETAHKDTKERIRFHVLVDVARKLLHILRIDTIPKYREIACVLLEKFFRLLFYTLDMPCIQILFQGINVFLADVLHGTGQIDGTPYPSPDISRFVHG